MNLSRPTASRKPNQVGYESVGGIVAPGGMVGVAAPALVQGINVVVAIQRLGNVVPNVGVAAQPVQQHQRRFAFGAPVQVVQFDAIGGNGSALRLYLRGHVYCSF